MISDRELIAFNQRGLIAGPGEDETAFIARVGALASKQSEEWKEAHRRTKELFDVEVDWVEVFYSKKDLPLWQGAVTWIEEGRAPLVQLRPALRHRALLGIYDKNEILAHESVHAARMAFEEPRFEELLAYQTSISAPRRYLGALFRTSREALLFFFLLLLFPIFQILDFFFDSSLFWLFPLPFLSPLFFSIRLIATQRTFSRALKALKGVVSSPLHLLFRLTDDEVAKVASCKEIEKFLREKRGTSLRWRQIELNYLQKRL